MFPGARYHRGVKRIKKRDWCKQAGMKESKHFKNRFTWIAYFRSTIPYNEILIHKTFQ